MHDIEWAGQTPSTTFGWRFVKLAGLPPKVDGNSRSKSATTLPFSRSRRTRTVLSFRFIGGPESYWLVRSSSSVYRVPGWLCAEDLFALVLREGSTW